MQKLINTILLFFLGHLVFAQTITQTLRGTITDRASEKPLSGATILVQGLSIGATSDASGRFEISGVPIGRAQLAISFNGYKPAFVPEILVTAGKEVSLDIALEQEIVVLKEVIVKAASRKGVAANEYIGGSARSFNPEVVQRFAGGRNDPSKLVSNYAGVISGNDSRNDIVVRGNSPTGVLWRIEGLPAPNPNHFGTLGTTGGPVTILNTNAIKGADFLTGAFPAEFGNATAAVFDISLRSGNANQHERTLQLNAFSGLEAMLEGPLSKKRKDASYLIGYRYSFAQIAQSIRLNLGTDAVPKYQDWVYNLDFGKTGKNHFSVYGMGGVSSIDFIGKDIDTADFYARQDQDAYATNNMLLFGAKHTLEINSKAYWRNHLSFSSNKDHFDQYQYENQQVPFGKRWLVSRSRNQTQSLRLHSYYNVKQSAQLSWRAGIQVESTNLNTDLRDKEGKPESAPFDQLRLFDDNFTLLQGYAQSRYKPFEALTITAGANILYLTLNSSLQISPRFSANLKTGRNSSLFFAYGNHAQQQPLPIYLLERVDNEGKIDRTNRELDFTKANHFIFGYEKRFSGGWRLKSELYHQYLYDVPVERESSGFSVLNEGADFSFSNRAGLLNRGSGTNTGIEFTLEKFLSKGWYLLATGSIFDSKYKGSDGIERNSTFNYQQVGNLLGGKEWAVGKSKKNALTLDIRAAFMGGRYQTPVDLDASLAAGKEILDESQFNAERLEGYFRLDTKFGFRINSKKKKFSQTFYLDLQNVTNRENIFLQRFNAQRGTIGNVYQLGFFPDIMWKVQF